MPNPTTTTTTPAGSPAGLFEPSDFAGRRVDGVLERVPLAELALARNPRQQISPEGIERLAGMLMRYGQLVPAIGRRTATDRVLLYAGQRRLLAAQASHTLAGSDGYQDLEPVGGLIVLLLDYEPSEADVRRIQAQENQREDLSMADQLEQFRDCYEDRAGLPEADRIAMVCADLGIAAKKAHNLRRCLLLPAELRERVEERPSGDRISVTMAKALADMQQISPALTAAVADRLTSTDLHDRAIKDLGAFVHRTVVEDTKVYAVRIDDGALLDAHDQIDRARQYLTDHHRPQLEAMFTRDDTNKDGRVNVDRELEALASRARSSALRIRVDQAMRERAANGMFAWVHQRGADFADGIWVVDPLFFIDIAHHQLQDDTTTVARDEAYFKASGVKDDDLADAAAHDSARREEERKRQARAVNSNLGLGQDIRAGLMDPQADQLKALAAIVVHILAAHYPDVLAFGAGWTDRDRQQPVGDTTRFEPRAIDTIVQAEITRALEDPEPLRGIAQFVARLCAAFLLDPTGVTRTKALGSDRMARKLRDALPGGQSPLRDSVWAFMRPMLSPHLADLHRDAFIADEPTDTVDLDAHRADSDLADLYLGDDDHTA